MHVRPASLLEAPSIAALLNENAEHTGRPATHNARSVLARIQTRGTVPERDAFVASESEQLLGFGHLWTEPQHRQVQCFARVRPSAAGTGAGTLLLSQAAAVSAQIFPGTHTLRCTSPSSDEAAPLLFAKNGFTAVQTFVSMHLDLDAFPMVPPAQQLRNLRIRSNPTAEELAGVYALYVRIYSDPAIKAMPFNKDRWANEVTTGNQYFDSNLWVQAFIGERLVGYVIAESHGEQGYVAEIGVDPNHRRTGIARLLFAMVADKLRRAGARSLRLEVDALNESGAIQFYENLGMTGIPRFTVWERTQVSADRRLATASSTVP